MLNTIRHTFREHASTHSRSRKIQIHSILTGLLTAAFAMAGVAPAWAVSSVVTNTNDSGSGSLRAAIASANGDTAADTISFDIPGSGPHFIQLASELPHVAHSTNITGPAAESITIRRNSGGNYCVLTFDAGSIYNVSNLTIANGSGVQGGGVRNSGTITLTNCTLSGNSAGAGGGVFTAGTTNLTNCTFTGDSAGDGGGGVSSNGTITVKNCTFSSNNAEYGGAISHNTGSLTMEDSTISGSTTTAFGGGIFNYASLTVKGSSITSNHSGPGNGGGICNFDTLTVNDSVISGNNTENDGGGIYSQGSLKVNRSTIRDNDAIGYGGGIHNYNESSLELMDSALSGNSNGSFGGGGGLVNNGNASVVNCTISGNDAAFGAGILNNSIATLNATNTTLTANIASNDGGGLFNDDGTVHLINSILAGNTAPARPDLRGILATSDHNLIGGNALLGPLQDNGGPTFTHALLDDSPALDAGNDIHAPAADQRGIARPQGGASDIGAFEAVQFQISGYVRTSTLAPISGATVSLASRSGFTNPTVQTDSDGFYRWAGVFPDHYSVTVTKSGWNFSPASQDVNVTAGSRAANFTGTIKASTYSISGRIASADGQSLPGVSVTLSPPPTGIYNPVQTNSAGYFTFYQVPAGDYTVVPALNGFSFTPGSRNVHLTDSSVGGQNFVGRSGSRLHGRVLRIDGSGVPGVAITRSGLATPTYSNNSGYYNFYNVPNGTVTLTPSKAGYLFKPVSKTLAVNDADILNQNFIAATGYTVSGRIAKGNGTALAGVDFKLRQGHSWEQTNPSVTTTSNSAGYFTFRNVADGVYTIIPSPLTGTEFTPDFSPQYREIVVAGGDIAGQNFIGLDPVR